MKDAKQESKCLALAWHSLHFPRKLNPRSVERAMKCISDALQNAKDSPELISTETVKKLKGRYSISKLPENFVVNVLTTDSAYRITSSRQMLEEQLATALPHLVVNTSTEVLDNNITVCIQHKNILFGAVCELEGTQQSVAQVHKCWLDSLGIYNFHPHFETLQITKQELLHRYHTRMFDTCNSEFGCSYHEDNLYVIPIGTASVKVVSNEHSVTQEVYQYLIADSDTQRMHMAYGVYSPSCGTVHDFFSRASITTWLGAYQSGYEFCEMCFSDTSINYSRAKKSV